MSTCEADLATHLSTEMETGRRAGGETLCIALPKRELEGEEKEKVKRGEEEELYVAERETKLFTAPKHRGRKGGCFTLP